MIQQKKAQHLVRQPALPDRHRTKHDHARAGRLLQRRHRLGDVIEIFLPGPVQQHDIRLELPRELQNLVVDRAALGNTGNIDIDRGNAGARGELRDAEVAAFLRLAQARHQRPRGRIPPEEDQRPAVLIDAVVGKRCFMAEVEHALVDPPL